MLLILTNNNMLSYTMIRSSKPRGGVWRSLIIDTTITIAGIVILIITIIVRLLIRIISMIIITSLRGRRPCPEAVRIGHRQCLTLD